MSGRLFDGAEGRLRRDRGMADVMHHEVDFAYQFHHAILSLPVGWIGQCENLRDGWTGIIPHPNAWGACWNSAVRKGLLREMPNETHMRAVKSHGRKTHLFMRTVP